MILSTFKHTVIFAIVAMFSLTSCTNKDAEKKTATIENLSAYKVVYKGPIDKASLAQFNDTTVTMADIERHSPQLIDLKQRQRDFEVAAAYKQIVEEKLVDGEKLEIIFNTSEPKAGLENILKLVNTEPSDQVTVTFNTTNNGGAFAIVGDEAMQLSKFDLNHKVYVDLKNKTHEETLDRLVLFITYSALKKAAQEQQISVTSLLQKNGLGEGEIATDEEVNDHIRSLGLPRDNINDDTFKKFRSIVTQKKQDQKVKEYVASHWIVDPITLYMNKPNTKIEIGPEKAIFKETKEAPVTTVLFTDLLCDNCKVAWENIKKVHQENSNQIKLGFNSFFANADNFGRFVAEAGHCVHKLKPDAFWGFIDLIQSASTEVDESFIRESAQTVGVEADQFHACLTNRETQEVANNQLEYAQSMGFTKIPTVIINGKIFQGPTSYETLSEIVKTNYEIQGKKGFFSKLWKKITGIFGI